MSDPTAPRPTLPGPLTRRFTPPPYLRTVLTVIVAWLAASVLVMPDDEFTESPAPVRTAAHSASDPGASYDYSSAGRSDYAVVDFSSFSFGQQDAEGNYMSTVNATNISGTTFAFADINTTFSASAVPTSASGEDNDGNPLTCYTVFNGRGCYAQNVGPGDWYYVTVQGTSPSTTTSCSYEVNKNGGGGPASDHTGDCSVSYQQPGDVLLGGSIANDAQPTDNTHFIPFQVENTGDQPASFTLTVQIERSGLATNDFGVSGPGTEGCQFEQQNGTSLATCPLTVEPSTVNEYQYFYFTVASGIVGQSLSIDVTSGENSDTGNDSIFGTTQYQEFVDFTLTKWTDVENPTLNVSYPYYITIANDGQSTARDVHIVDQLANESQYVDANISWPVSTDLEGQVDFGPGEIPAGESETFEYRVVFTPDAFTCSESQRDNFAEVVYSGGVDLDTANNTATSSIFLCDSSFSGRVCVDSNVNGLCDENEEGVENVRIYFFQFETFTDSEGDYIFSSIPRFSYPLSIDVPAEYNGPSDPVIALVNDQIITGIDIPFTVPGGDIHIHKFWDQDGDGEQDESDGGLDGVQFALYSGGNLVREAVSAPMDMNSDGMYDPNTERGVVWWQDVPPGEYVLQEVVPTGAVITTHGSNQIPVTVSANNETVIFIGNQPPGADWGDLPDPRTDLPGPCPIGGVDLECYKTLAGARGAAHMVDPDNPDFLALGQRVDTDPDGQPTVLADGDDLNISSTGGVDDEDGWLETRVLGDGTIEVDIVVFDPSNEGGTVDIFIDLNDDGVMNDGSFPGGAREHVIRTAVTSGVNTVESPPGTFQEGDILGYMRIRLSKRGTNFAWGGAPEGEVEDYTHFEFDFGDALDAEDPERPQFPFGYPTVVVQNPAFHRVSENFHLGDRIDGESNGQPTPEADGDDSTPTLESDDEDGVRFASDFISLQLKLDPGSDEETVVPGLVRGTDAVIEVSASAAGYLNAWVDWNRDGDWADDGEQMFDGLPLNPGDTELDWAAPEDAGIGFTYARFRFTPGQTDVGFDMYEGIGEVEDYLMLTLGVRELESTADTPDADPGDGVCADASGMCTLRAAIMETNAGDIPYVVSGEALGKSGAATLAPQSPYPAVTGTLILNGNATLEIDGSQAGAGAHGLEFQSSGNLVTSTYLHSFDGDGIRIESSGNNVFDVRSWNNGGAGVNVASGAGNFIRTNSIDGNGGPGIDLGDDGVTENDDGDADAGANDLQNYPVLTSVTVEGAIEGGLESTPDTEFVLDFFASPGCDASGNGEGARYLGSAGVSTDGAGSASFSVELEGAGLQIGDAVTATATGESGGTSEFSSCFEIIDVGVERTEDVEIPNAYRLSQSYPNPFNPVTTIEFAVPQNEFVRIDVYDMLGKHVARIVNRQVEAGEYSVRFDASALPSGTYLYRMTAGSYGASKHFTLLK